MSSLSSPTSKATVSDVFAKSDEIIKRIRDCIGTDGAFLIRLDDLSMRHVSDDDIKCYFISNKKRKAECDLSNTTNNTQDKQVQTNFVCYFCNEEIMDEAAVHQSSCGCTCCDECVTKCKDCNKVVCTNGHDEIDWLKRCRDCKKAAKSAYMSRE